MHTNSAVWSKTLTKVSYAKIGLFERLGIIKKKMYKQTRNGYGKREKVTRRIQNKEP